MNLWRLLVPGLMLAAAAVAGEPVKLDSTFNIDEVKFVKLSGTWRRIRTNASSELTATTARPVAG